MIENEGEKEEKNEQTVKSSNKKKKVNRTRRQASGKIQGIMRTVDVIAKKQEDMLIK